MLLHSLVVQLVSDSVTPMDCSRPCFPILYHLPEFTQVKLFSHVWLFAAPWSVVCQAPLFMGFSRQEYWSGLLFPSSRDLPDTGIEPGSLALQADPLPSEPPGKTWSLHKLMFIGLVMPSNHLIPYYPFSCCPQSFPALGSLPMSRLVTSGGQSIGASALHPPFQWIFSVVFLHV